MDQIKFVGYISFGKVSRFTTFWRPGPRLNIKTVLSTYGDFHVKDKTAVRSLIFNMGIAIPGKTVFLIETAPRSEVKVTDSSGGQDI